MTVDFKDKYGPWGLVAGASVGLGAAFADELAARGLNLVLIARRSEPLKKLEDELKSRYGVDIRTVQLDLASPELIGELAPHTDDIEIGLMIYDTAFHTIGAFFNQTLENHLRHIEVNCQGPLILTYHFGGKMMQRGRGGIILMSSLSGFHGNPLLANYGGTKAFNTILGEGLWYEMKQHGVDAMVSVAGAIETPNYIETKPNKLSFGPGPMKPVDVARETVAALGKTHTFIPGRMYRLSSSITNRFMTRTRAIKIMAGSTTQMYGDRNLITNPKL
jgi:short-subunit dehydrogenase